MRSKSSKRPILALPETIRAIETQNGALSEKPAPLYKHLEPNAPNKKKTEQKDMESIQDGSNK